jgi:serine/threonine protein kinase
MEWIDGDTLDTLLDAGTPLPKRKIASELCDSVAYLHHKQVIHKDLKPENILITKRGNNVKIIDFGLSDSDSILTGKEPAGTLEYAAPEVVAGGPADQQSDIYSLGKVLLSLGGEFQQVAASCCEPDPRKRPTDADEVLKALEYGKKRNPLPVILIAASLIAAAALLTVVTGRHDEIKDLFESAVRLTNQAGASAF